MDPQALIQDYLDGGLTEVQFATLSDWLAECEANREAFTRAVMLDNDIHHHLSNADLHTFLEEVDVHAIHDVIQKSQEDSSSAMLSITEEEIKPQHELTFREALGVLSHTGLQWSEGVIRRHATQLGLAAAILLGITLMIVLSRSSNEPSTQTAIDHTSTPEQAAVARLTGSQDAVWSGETPRIGEALQPGQTLELYRGFAQVTTALGAQAMLQGPCTIELTDSDNGLRLTSGSLLAYVPPSAVGFEVRTRNASIVDLGTRFGVAADPGGKTVLEVFTGEISVAPITVGQIEPASIMIAGQSALVHDGNVALKPDSPDPDTSRFAEVIAFEQAFNQNNLRDLGLSGDSLVAYYSFDQPTGQFLLESRGLSLFDATIDRARWATGRTPDKSALSFFGQDERVVLSQEASEHFDVQGSFTMSIWLKLDQGQEGWVPLLTRGNDSWRLQARPTEKDLRLGFYVNNDENVAPHHYTGLETNNIETDRWCHVVVTGQKTEEGSFTRLYLNGELQKEKLLPLAPASDWPVMIGANAEQHEDFALKGLIDEIAFHQRVLSEEEVRRLYNAGAVNETQ
jgi:hypothetical protein